MIEQRLIVSAETRRSPALGARILTCVAVLVVGLLCAYPNPIAIFYIHLYPTGFSRSMGIETRDYAELISYGFPVVCCVGILASRARSTFLSFAGLLILYCILCAEGCREMLGSGDYRQSIVEPLPQASQRA